MKDTGTVSERSSMVKAAGVVGGATFISRVLGLCRDGVMAFLFGAASSADAFYVAFRIPNLMRQLFGEGALAASFVPVYTDILEHRGPEEARKFASGLFTLLVAILSVLSAGMIIFAPQVVRLVAWGFDPRSDVFSRTVVLTRWLAPYMMFICLAALGMGILNARRHFLAPALAPVLLNVSIIVFALLVSPALPDPIVGVAWGVLVGGVLQILIQVGPLKARDAVPLLTLKVMSPGVKRVAVMMGPAALGVAVYQVNMVVDTLVASFLPAGSITYLWYGNRLMQFPLGVFGIALATAALPTLSAQFSAGRFDDFSRTVSFSLSLTAFIGFPAALGLIALREPIISTLFARGAFGEQDVIGSAAALMFYSVGIPFFIGVKIMGRAFFSMEDTRTPFTGASMAMVANVLLNLLLMGPMLHAGLALATSLASMLNFGFLASRFSVRRGKSWMTGGLLREAGKSLFASVLMFGTISLYSQHVNWLSAGTLTRAALLLGCVALGIIVYFATALALRCEGAMDLKTKLFSRGKG